MRFWDHTWVAPCHVKGEFKGISYGATLLKSSLQSAIAKLGNSFGATLSNPSLQSEIARLRNAFEERNEKRQYQQKCSSKVSIWKKCKKNSDTSIPNCNAVIHLITNRSKIGRQHSTQYRSANRFSNIIPKSLSRNSKRKLCSSRI